jgi:hypothetical protein
MRRREFLLGVGAAAAVPWTGWRGDRGGPARGLRALARGLGALGRALDGRLVRPRDAAYSRARLLFNPRFDGSRPLAIAYAAGAADVARAIRSAREHDVHVVARSGGHSYAALAAHRLALSAGSCPSVGIAGLTLGGGSG